MPANGASIDLGSNWTVTIGQKSPVRFAGLKSWADEEANRYFSGTASYEKSFEVPASFLGSGNQTLIDFDDGQALDAQPQRNGMRTWYDPPIREAAVIYVNGQKAGALWCPPYKLDVTKFLKAGNNSVKIVVGNTALNFMSGRKLPDYKLLNLRFGERFQPQEMEKIQPLPSGLIGTVRLISSGK